MRWLILPSCLMALSAGCPLAWAQAPSAQAPSAAAPSPAAPSAQPPDLNLSDPLLTQQLPAQQVLSNWQQAIALVRSHSTNVKSALLQIQQAQAQSRQALAQSLPSLTANAILSRHLLLGEGTQNPFAPANANVGKLPDPATTWQAGATLRVPVREALGLALGSEKAWSVAPDIKLDALVGDANAVCRRQRDINLRSDVLVAQSNVDLASRRLKSVDYSFYPSVDLVSTATLFGNTDQTPNRERVTWTVAGVLNWTLYDGGARYAGRDVAATQLGLAKETTTDTRRRALLQLSQTARAVKVAEANLQVSRQARDISQKSSELSKVAFINGAGTAFDVVDTERRLRSGELDLAIKEFELVKAKITALLAQASCDI